MYACSYWHRSAGRADSPFIHSFLKMPYPEADGIRYFFAPRPGMRRAVPWRHAAEIDLHLSEALLKGYTHTDATGLRSCVASHHAENLWGHAAESGLPPGSAKSYAYKRCRASPPGHCGGNGPNPCRSPAKRPYAHRVAGLRSRAPPTCYETKGQPNGCPLGVSVLGRIRAPCSGSPSDGGSGGLQTALPVYFPPASCRPPGRSHGWQPPGQSPSHG